MAGDASSRGRGGAKKIIVQESTSRRMVEQSRVRILCVGLFFTLCFSAIGVRLVEISWKHRSAMAEVAANVVQDDGTEDAELLTRPSPTIQRGNIVDRNGMLLASSLTTASLFANPKELRNADQVAAKLEKVLGVSAKTLLARFSNAKSFTWVKRNLTPKEQQTVNSLGIPGLYFLPEQKRVYPYGPLFSHVLGYVGVDNKGLAGIEKSQDGVLTDALKNREPLYLSLDLRVQSVVHQELQKAVKDFNAIGGAAVVQDVRTGEVLAMVSLPDFDPQAPGKSKDTDRFNRATLGTYEMGSTFKTFTMAVALESGTVKMQGGYDATNPLKYANFTISDTHPKRRWLSVPEIYAYSSNIGTARMILDVGVKRQKEFMKKLGMLDPLPIELPEKAAPQYPASWKELSMITIAYGHGISVTPMHLVHGIATIARGGVPLQPTFLKDGNANRKPGEAVVSEETSRNLRRLMRIVVEFGTGGKADIAGYRVGGKTGTAEKITSGGGYSKHANLSSFVAVFPTDAPRYAILVMLDEPQGNKSTYGFTTGGWVAAPVVGRIVDRIAPIQGVRPEYDAPADDADRFWVSAEKKPAPVASVQPAVTRRFVHATSY